MVVRPAAVADAAAACELVREIAESMLASHASDPDLVAAARDYLADVSTATPLGAASVAALVFGHSRADGRGRDFVDAWLSDALGMDKDHRT